MAERKLFLVCRNSEREGTIRPLLVRPDEVSLVGVYRVADSTADFRALLEASHPEALYVDSSIPPREALELALTAKHELPRVVVVIGIAEKSFDFLQEAILKGVDVVLAEPVGRDELRARMDKAFRERQRSLEFLRLARQQIRVGAGSGDEAGMGGAREPGVTLAFISSKHGEGRSTVALNLGLSLAKHFGKRVIYIDLDETISETGMMLNRKPPGTFLNVLAQADGAYTPESLSRHAIDYFGDGSFLAICGNLTIEPPQVDRDALDLLLCFLRFHFDFVLLDCPVRFGDVLKTALELSDWHVAVVQNTLSSLRNARIYLAELKRLGFSPEQVRVVLNRVSKTAGLARDDIEKNLNPYPIVSAIVSNGPVAIEAVTVGKPLILHAPDSDLAQSLNGFAKRLLGIETHEVGEHAGFGIRAMFSSLFGRRGA